MNCIIEVQLKFVVTRTNKAVRRFYFIFIDVIKWNESQKHSMQWVLLIIKSLIMQSNQRTLGLA